MERLGRRDRQGVGREPGRGGALGSGERHDHRLAGGGPSPSLRAPAAPRRAPRPPPASPRRAPRRPSRRAWRRSRAPRGDETGDADDRCGGHQSDRGRGRVRDREQHSENPTSTSRMTASAITAEQDRQQRALPVLPATHGLVAPSRLRGGSSSSSAPISGARSGRPTGRARRAAPGRTSGRRSPRSRPRGAAPRPSFMMRPAIS